MKTRVIASAIALGIGATLPLPALAAEWPATVHWARRAALAPTVSGTIAQVEADVGDIVKKDQVLLALDEVPFKSRLLQAQANMTEARIARDEAKRDLAQADELYRRTVLSTVELDNAKNKLARAEAAQQQAQAQLMQAQYEQDKSRLRAPFAGWIVARKAEVGQAVAASLEPPVLLVVAARGQYRAQAWVSAAQATNLQSGQDASVAVAGKRYPGKIQSVGFESIKDSKFRDALSATDADGNAKTTKDRKEPTGKESTDAKVEVSVLFQTGDTMLRPGQAASVILP